MRTVIYARFSSALQNSRSIDDQIRVCRERADREGWSVVDVFTDYAISGAAGIGEANRPGLSAMLDAVERGGIDQVLAESTDRIARHQGDSFTIRERLEYAGARLFTLSDGAVDDITGTFKGLMDARFRKELGAKIKRGQQGTLAQGRAPAGLAYGYRKANRLEADGRHIRGLREIDADQAEIVQRIFTEFAAGLSARTIAEKLNADEIPGPTGGTWRASTILGDRQRQNGMLQNQLYAGVLVHNRTSKVIDPRTRKVRIKPNPMEMWISQPVPELRIISDDLWERVREQRGEYEGVRSGRARRPKHILSGLVFCGVCGGGFINVGLNYWACGRNRDGGGCSNNRSARVDTLEGMILTGLTDQMLDPKLVSIYVGEYHRDYARRAGELARDRTRLERRHSEACRKIERLVGAIAEGGEEFVEIREVMRKARADRDQLAEQIAELEALPVIALHPTIAEDYRRQALSLVEAMSANEASRLEALPILRELIERVEVFSAGEKRGVTVDVQGRLASILAMAMGTEMPKRSAFSVTDERVKGIEPSS